MSINTFKYSKVTDSEGQKIVEHDLFRVVKAYDIYPSKKGYIVCRGEKFFMTFLLDDGGESMLFDLEGNNFNIEIVGSREDIG